MEENQIVVSAQRDLPSIAYTYPEDGNPVATYISSLKSENSRRVMRHTLRRIITVYLNCELKEIPDIAVKHFAWHTLRYQHINLLRAKLIEMFSPTAVNRHLSAVRGVLKECWRLNYIDAETYRRAVDVANVQFEIIPAGRDIPEREFRLMLLQCYDDGKAGIRDLAILAVLATTGVRRSELAKVTLADFDRTTGAIKVLFGKGGKQRVVYAQNRTFDILLEWLKVRGDFEGALFTSIRKNDAITRKPFPSSAIHQMIVDRSARAGIDKVTPHDFRRKFVGDMLDKNVDMVTISKLTGHSDPRMLQRYDRRSEETKRQAVAKLDLPI